MSNFDILEQRQSTFKTSSKSKILSHVYEEYTDSQIKEMYDMLTGTSSSTFNYGLTLNVGDKIIGKLVGESNTDYLFNIGYKDYLRVEKRKSESDALARFADDNDVVSFETEIEILVTEVSEKPYTIKGSLSALHKSDTYTDILKNTTEPIDAIVLSAIPAGFTLELRYNNYKIPAFMPNILAGVNKLSSQEGLGLVGKTIQVLIESYSSEKGTFIASRKKYLQSLIPYEIENLKIKDEQNRPILYTGIVTGTAKFGIFLQFKNDVNDSESNICVLTAMLHKDNLGDTYKTNYQDVKPGTEIQFFVKEIIKDKIILTQVWKDTIWDSVKNGSEFEGVVCGEKSFGLLVRLDTETLGLVHNSEIPTDNKPSIGDTIKVKVIAIQKLERKIYLTIK